FWSSSNAKECVDYVRHHRTGPVQHRTRYSPLSLWGNLVRNIQTGKVTSDLAVSGVGGATHTWGDYVPCHRTCPVQHRARYSPLSLWGNLVRNIQTGKVTSDLAVSGVGGATHTWGDYVPCHRTCPVQHWARYSPLSLWGNFVRNIQT